MNEDQAVHLHATFRGRVTSNGLGGSRRGIVWVMRAVAAVALILGIAGMHASFGSPAMDNYGMASMAGESQTMAAQEHAVINLATSVTSTDSMGEMMQGMMHACMFLVAVALLALLASPAFVIWGPQLLPRLLAQARRHPGEQDPGINEILAFRVLRI
jgi:hypothetical protein